MPERMQPTQRTAKVSPRTCKQPQARAHYPGTNIPNRKPDGKQVRGIRGAEWHLVSHMLIAWKFLGFVSCGYTGTPGFVNTWGTALCLCSESDQPYVNTRQ